MLAREEVRARQRTQENSGVIAIDQVASVACRPFPLLHFAPPPIVVADVVSLPLPLTLAAALSE